MSYDIELLDPVSREVLNIGFKHEISGGIRCVGGTTKLWLNVTYNYAPLFKRTLGDDGIRTIYGMTGAESLPFLEAAASSLGDNVSSNYWEATEGNVKKALLGLIEFARLRPEGVWYGD